MLFLEILLGIVLIQVYFLPTVQARYRHHRNAGAIFMLNFLLGWTVIGWIAALIWASTADVLAVPPPPNGRKIP